MLRFSLDLQPDLSPARLLLADLQSGAHQTAGGARDAA